MANPRSAGSIDGNVIPLSINETTKPAFAERIPNGATHYLHPINGSSSDEDELERSFPVKMRTHAGKMRELSSSAIIAEMRFRKMLILRDNFESAARKTLESMDEILNQEESVYLTAYGRLDEELKKYMPHDDFKLAVKAAVLHVHNRHGAHRQIKSEQDLHAYNNDESTVLALNLIDLLTVFNATSDRVSDRSKRLAALEEFEMNTVTKQSTPAWVASFVGKIIFTGIGVALGASLGAAVGVYVGAWTAGSIYATALSLYASASTVGSLHAAASALLVGATALQTKCLAGAAVATVLSMGLFANSVRSRKSIAEQVVEEGRNVVLK